MFQQTLALFQLTLHVGSFKTFDKVSVKLHLNHDACIQHEQFVPSSSRSAVNDDVECVVSLT